MVIPTAASCTSSEPNCWGLNNGDHLALELVDAYTPNSPYLYKALATDLSPSPTTVDQLPSCGADFDFQVGETIQITTVALSDVDESDACRTSRFQIDSPVRLGGQLASAQAGILFIAGQEVLYSSDTITLNGCPSRRELMLITLGDFPGPMTDPVVGQLPSFVLVRSAWQTSLADGSCFASASSLPPVCADQFVVRVKPE